MNDAAITIPPDMAELLAAFREKCGDEIGAIVKGLSGKGEDLSAYCLLFCDGSDRAVVERHFGAGTPLGADPWAVLSRASAVEGLSEYPSVSKFLNKSAPEGWLWAAVLMNGTASLFYWNLEAGAPAN